MEFKGIYMFDDRKEAALVGPTESHGIFTAEVGGISDHSRRIGRHILLTGDENAIAQLKAGNKDAIYSLVQKPESFDGRYKLCSATQAFIFDYWNGTGQPGDIEELFLAEFTEYEPHIEI